MNLGQINILHVISAVIVPNLSSSPIDAFNLDDLSILDRATEGNYPLSMVSGLLIASSTNCLGAIGSIADKHVKMQSEAPGRSHVSMAVLLPPSLDPPSTQYGSDQA